MFEVVAELDPQAVLIARQKSKSANGRLLQVEIWILPRRESILVDSTAQALTNLHGT
jgi:hypothetical protein